MTDFLLKHKYLLLFMFACIISFILFYPSLFVFYTNDDFFNLAISNTYSFSGFFNFFNLMHGPSGWGLYRPLTTQVFYFLAHKVFNLNPFPQHIILFILFFGILILIYKLLNELFKNKQLSIVAIILYAVSATNFGRLYFLSTQELGVAFFVLLSCLAFVKKKYLVSVIFFVLALMSKETAVITPGLLFLIYFYQKFTNEKVITLKRFFIFLSLFIICLFVYLLIRIKSYGFTTGDSYIWSFSPLRLINSLGWYLLWSFNIPESFVDFVGPGLNINYNLFLYWGNQVRPILILFIVQLIFVFILLVKVILNRNKRDFADSNLVSSFCALWFFVSLLPVIFLPFHKFSFYVTLALIGVVARISYLFVQVKLNKILIGVFILLWTATSYLTLRFAYDTSWITQGSMVAKRVNEYFTAAKDNLSGKKIYFVDTKEDKTLPWSPTSVVRTVLSDKSYFKVFYPGLVDNVYYNGEEGQGVKINSRQFLGY